MASEIIMGLKICYIFQCKGICFLGAFGFCLQVLICGTVKPPKCLNAVSFWRLVQQIVELVASSNQAAKRQIPWNGLINTIARYKMLKLCKYPVIGRKFQLFIYMRVSPTSQACTFLCQAQVFEHNQVDIPSQHQGKVL